MAQIKGVYGFCTLEEKEFKLVSYGPGQLMAQALVLKELDEYGLITSEWVDAPTMTDKVFAELMRKLDTWAARKEVA